MCLRVLIHMAAAIGHCITWKQACPHHVSDSLLQSFVEPLQPSTAPFLDSQSCAEVYSKACLFCE